MTKQDLLKLLEAAVPHLAGQLHPERVLYKKSINKAYITYLCDSLVSEKDFLTIERKLRQSLPQVQVAVRVASPGLAEDFLRHVDKYQSVLTDFLRRQSPALRAWVDDVGWQIVGQSVVLTCPDDFSVQFFRKQKLDEKLSQAIWDIFRLRLPVQLEVCGAREQWVAEMRKSRHYEPLPPPLELNGADFSAPEADKASVPAAKSASAASPSDAPRRAAPSGGVKPTAKGGAVVKGRGIADKPVPIGELTDEAGIVVIDGIVTGLQEPKELKGGETVLSSFAVYDDSGTVYCKAFYQYRMKRRMGDEPPPPPTQEEKDKVKQQLALLKNGMRLRVRGECRQDSFLGELCVSVRDAQEYPIQKRQDTAEEKRIELHMHSSMSAMDATSDAGDLVARAAAWGHPAVAITDHGVLQAFPAAFGAAKKTGIKLIPGVEGYLCDLASIVTQPDDRLLADTTFVVFDVETTGLSSARDRIIEIGAVKMQGGQVVAEYSSFCDPGVPLPQKITDLTHITDLMLKGEKAPGQAVAELLDFSEGCVLCAHNASFDIGFVRAECERSGLPLPSGPVLDTLTMARRLYASLRSHKLGAVCKFLGVSLKNAHRAVHDAAATGKCLALMLSQTQKQGVTTLAGLDETIKGRSIGETYHIILLAKSQKGMENLNRMVSAGHLDYFYRHPNLPRHLIEQYREGVIVGSACEAGELFRAVLANRPDDELERIAEFYDYLEIQPIGNNEFLVREGAVPDDEGLRDLNRRILALGRRLGKPVVATGDVHFMDPSDAVYRSILQAGQGFEDCDQQPPLYFKTTQEMLEEFAYLGPEDCHAVVINAPKQIADQVEPLRLFPKHPKDEETFQPFWPEAANDIETMSRTRAKELYGDPLPELIEKRLDKELGSIIGYGFATLYSIAQKLVSKSLSDGYLVGSRGSVGSSFVATMCGITEVNSLPPHYRCDHCHKAFFTPPDLATVGVDLPPKNCELCGEPMARDGFDIPFEVFLGFKGDKVPDIDLNFSGEYQAKAHKYIETLFGEGNVYRAGTISGLAEKTAYGYASKYLEERGIHAGRAHRERLAAGCVGVKRTTGQHPGGIVVLPKEYQIYQFTAIQHPADDIGGDTLTTHYDFRSMHDILVKLDCLGHDDPTMMHRMEELTGVSWKTIPLSDKGAMSLFLSPEALGVTAEEILCPTGTLGIPEFGTDFVIGMLTQTKPTTMEELIRISGLSHGTDVWLGNASDLIDSGTATLKECICTRDDIMNYLISRGVESKMSFDTMESVRKGRGLKPEMEAAMIEHEVPQWFIDSCKKIKYMFPKGHAVAYVTMALRVAWYKVYRPLAYYAAYLTIRADGFDAARMILSKESQRQRVQELQARDEKLSPKDKDEQNAFHLLLEMTCRGIELLPIDLYKSDVHRFLIEGGNIRAPFCSISGFPEATAESIAAARSEPFLSVEDLRSRAKVGVSVVEMLRAQGALSNLPESSQVDLFSLMG